MNIFKSIKDMITRSSLENPSVPLTSDVDYSYNMSGVPVNEESAKRYETVLTCLNIISSDVGKVPTVIYKRAEGGKEKATTHPAYNLLRYQPNPHMGAMTFKQTLQAHALTQGNGYAYIFRDRYAKPTELAILDPQQTYPVRKDGKLYYITTIDYKMHKLDPSNVLHIKGLGYDGLVGYSIVKYASSLFGWGMASEGYGQRFFNNNATPSLILEHPAGLSPEAKKTIVDSWNKMYSGIAQSHSTAIMEQGMKINTLAISAKDAQLIEGIQNIDRKIASLFRIPVNKIGDSSATSYSSLEQENLSYLSDGLEPWFIQWEEEIRSKLFKESEKKNDTHIVEFIREALVRTDIATKSAFYKESLAGAPYMTVNEVRNMQNLNPLDDPKYDEIILPANLFGLQNTEEDVDDNDTSTDESSNVDSDDSRNVSSNEKITAKIDSAFEHVKQRMIKRVKNSKDKDILKHEEIIRRELTHISDLYEATTGEENSIVRLYNIIKDELNKE